MNTSPEWKGCDVPQARAAANELESRHFEKEPESMLKPRFAVLSVVVVLAALWRVVPHPWNLTPVSAMALFAGARFSSRRTAYALPLAAMILSNVFLGSFYATLPFVLGCFALIVAIGTQLRGRGDAISIGGASLAGSLLFFIVTNAAHWALAPDY